VLDIGGYVVLDIGGLCWISLVLDIGGLYSDIQHNIQICLVESVIVQPKLASESLGIRCRDLDWSQSVLNIRPAPGQS